jgi:hypothetical protein
MKTESIRVASKTKAKVKKHIKKSKQSIGGFYDLAAEEKIARDIAMEAYIETGLQIQRTIPVK